MRKLISLSGTPALGGLFCIFAGLCLSAPLSFEKEILPVLEARCAKCHAGSEPQAGLDIRSLAALLKGGASGPAIHKGSPQSSPLYIRVKAGQMPMGGPRLPAEEQDLLKRWIEQGAPAESVDPHPVAEIGTRPADRAHWAFQPPKRPALPPLKHPKRVRTPVDQFLLAQLERKKLTFSPDADKITLLRRVTYDLTGLPPTPQEADAFVADRSARAYEKVVERLLSSPRYGERWARHWLDLAGYADSEGVLAADVIRDNAWRYRDYVIRSFNADKPYDLFLREQLAGDELYEYWKYDRLPPQVVEGLEATGYLRTAVDGTRQEFQLRDFTEYNWRTFVDTYQIVTSGLLGLSMHCARCHDHKYEPISQRDYYRMQAFLGSAIRPGGPVLASSTRSIVEATAAEKAAAEKVNKPLDAVLKALQSLQSARLSQYRAMHPKGDEATADDLKAMFPDYKAKAEAVAAELKVEEAKRIRLPSIRAINDVDGTPPAFHVLRRGNFLQPGEEVQPGVPRVLEDPTHPVTVPTPEPDAKTSGWRTTFAAWLTRADHPLTARVFVNHVWARHFGRGILATLDNFGVSGEKPSNQALLDWLATEFVQRGWSIKELHRVIVTATAYRQSSQSRREGLGADPENIMVWRMSPRRLEAEAVHDAMLAVAGKLDVSMYGKPVTNETKKSGEGASRNETEPGDRRAVYHLVRRSAPEKLLDAFDAPLMEINCTRRKQSVTVTQALAQLNSDFVTAQAGHFAKRVLAETPPATANGRDADTVERAFRLAFARHPTANEKDLLLGFLAKQEKYYPDLDPSQRRDRTYADLCQAMLSANEFIYID